MKQIVNVIIIFIVGFALSYIAFNHIYAWLGVILFIATIGVILKYSYKQLKNKQNEKN
jgi:FtsH-binding integral membrane protein